MNIKSEESERSTTDTHNGAVVVKRRRSTASPDLPDKRQRAELGPLTSSSESSFSLLVEAVHAAATSVPDSVCKTHDSTLSAAGSVSLIPATSTPSDMTSLPPYSSPDPLETENEVLRRRLQAAEFEVLCAQLKAAKAKAREYRVKNRELSRRLEEAQEDMEALRQLRRDAEFRAASAEQSGAVALRNAEDQIAASEARAEAAEAQAAAYKKRVLELENELVNALTTLDPASPSPQPPPPASPPPPLPPPPPTLPAITLTPPSEVDSASSLQGDSVHDSNSSSVHHSTPRRKNRRGGRRHNKPAGQASAASTPNPILNEGTVSGYDPHFPALDTQPTTGSNAMPNAMPISLLIHPDSPQAAKIKQLYRLHGEVQSFLSTLRARALRLAEQGHMQAPGWVRGLEGLCGLNGLYLIQIWRMQREGIAGAGDGDLEEHLRGLKGVAENVEREMGS